MARRANEPRIFILSETIDGVMTLNVCWLLILLIFDGKWHILWSKNGQKINVGYEKSFTLYFGTSFINLS